MHFHSFWQALSHHPQSLNMAPTKAREPCIPGRGCLTVQSPKHHGLNVSCLKRHFQEEKKEQINKLNQIYSTKKEMVLISFSLSCDIPSHDAIHFKNNNDFIETCSKHFTMSLFSEIPYIVRHISRCFDHKHVYNLPCDQIHYQ